MSLSNAGITLSVRDYNVSYKLGGKFVDAVRNLNFDLPRGQILGIIGESGAGKSTVGWGILGMIASPHKVSGSILSDGVDVLKMSQQELTNYRWTKVAMIFQSAMNSLDPVITIGKNFGQILLDKSVVSNRAEAKIRIAELLRTVGLSSATADMYPFELSGGMKQRVSIAMALAASPSLLIADEPTTALDTITQFSILTTLLDLRKSGKIGSLILISHDLSVQAFMVDEAMVMLKGRLVEKGSKKDIFKNPKHPYTQFLMRSLKLDRRLNLAPKKMTNETELLSHEGCPFTQSCPYSMQKCFREFPGMTGLSPSQSVACFLYGGD